MDVDHGRGRGGWPRMKKTTRFERAARNNACVLDTTMFGADAPSERDPLGSLLGGAAPKSQARPPTARK